LPFIRQSEVQSIIRPQLAAGSSSQNQSVDLHKGLSALTEAYEKEILILALKKFEKDIDRVSQTLQISRSNLYKKIKDHNIDPEKL
jgi:DNA-binding NtrC family response regulator